MNKAVSAIVLSALLICGLKGYVLADDTVGLIYSTSPDTPKADGVQFEIKYPSDWKARDGETKLVPVMFLPNGPNVQGVFAEIIIRQINAPWSPDKSVTMDDYKEMGAGMQQLLPAFVKNLTSQIGEPGQISIDMVTVDGIPFWHERFTIKFGGTDQNSRILKEEVWVTFIHRDMFAVWTSAGGVNISNEAANAVYAKYQSAYRNMVYSIRFKEHPASGRSMWWGMLNFSDDEADQVTKAIGWMILLIGIVIWRKRKHKGDAKSKEKD